MPTWLLSLAALAGMTAALVAYIVLGERALGLVSAHRQSTLRPWLWLAPALGLLGLFIAYPVGVTAHLSLRGPTSERFVGLANFAFAFTNGEMLAALRNNLLWLTLFTALTVGLGLLLALLADGVPYEPHVKAALFLPMAVSFTAAGVIWKFVFEFRPAGAAQIGLLNGLLAAGGLQPTAWLVTPVVNNLALIVVGVWVWVGFCLVILSAALKDIPSGSLEAARVDGASEWQVLWRITLPLLRPTITVAATTMAIFALKAFDIVYVMTNGNFDTEVVANRMYKELFNFRDFGRASALALILFAATVPVMIVNVRRFRSRDEARV